MPSPTELLSCKGKAATADAKYRLKARKLKSFRKPSTIPMELGIPKRFLLSYLAFCWKASLKGGTKKAMVWRVCRNVIKKSSVSCGKQVFKKAGAQEIQNFPRGGRAEAGHDYTCHVVWCWETNGKIYSKIVQYAYMQYIYSESVKIEVSLCRWDRCRRNLLSLHA